MSTIKLGYRRKDGPRGPFVDIFDIESGRSIDGILASSVSCELGKVTSITVKVIAYGKNGIEYIDDHASKLKN